MKKKLILIVLTLLTALTFCFGMTACSDKIVSQLQNASGAILEGGNFKEGSVLNMSGLDVTAEQADEIFEKLEEIGVKIDDKTKAYIFDIFVTKDGKKVQPEGKVKLTVPMSQDAEEADYLVYHVKDGGEVVKITSAYKDGKLTFETDGFSYFVIISGKYVKINTSGGNENIGKYQHTLTVTAEPANSGYIMIDGEEKDVSNGILLNAGTTYELYADGNKGYVFIGWYDADSNEIISENSKYSVKLSGDLRLIAKFKKTNTSDENIGKYQHTLTVTVEPENAGYIEIGGEKKDASKGILLDAGQSYDIRAIENEGWEFIGWYDADSDETVAEDDVYSVYMSGNQHLVAKFKEAPYTLNLTQTLGGAMSLNGESIPSQSASESIDRNASVTLQASAWDSYEFIGWYNAADSALLSNSETYTFTMDGDKSIEAHFKHLPVKVSVTVTPEGAGYFELADGTTCTKIDEQMEVDTSFTVEVVANFGYKFLHWEDMDTNVTYHYGYGARTISVTENGVNYRAVFEELPNHLFVTATDGGKINATVTGEASDGSFVTEYKNAFRNSTKVELCAEEDVGGYRFVGWYDGNGKLLGSDYTYTVWVDGEVTVVAKFEKIVEYTVTATAGEGGTVTDGYANGAKVEKGTSVTLKATPNTKYHFVGWFSGETKVSDNASYTFTVNEDTTLVAKFEKDAPVKVSVTVNLEGAGYFKLDGATDTKIDEQMEIGTTIWIKAVANFGYRFLYWEKVGTQETVKDEEITLTVPEEGLNYRAVFEELEYQLEVTVSGNGYISFVKTEGKEITDFLTEYKKATDHSFKVTLSAVAIVGNEFVGWYKENGESVYPENYEVTGKVKLVAKFEKIVEYTVTATAGEGGNVTLGYADGKKVEKGTSVTLDANPNAGYHFVGWFSGETKVSNNASYTFTVNENTTLVAKFEKNVEYTVTATAGEGGTITDGYANGKKVEDGTSVTLTATPNKNYRFIGWFSGETKVYDNANYTFTVNANTTLVAKFEKDPPVKVSVTVTSEGAGYFELADGTTCTKIDEQMEVGTSFTLTAVANFGYKFLHWEDMDTNVTYHYGYGARTISVTENGVNYRAVFEELPNRLIVTATDGGKISATVTGETTEGAFVSEYKSAFRNITSVELNAQVGESGYRFIGWYDEKGKLLGSGFDYTVSVDGEVTVVAKFEKIVEYTVTATAGEGGTVTDGYANGKKVEKGTSVTLTATANNNYNFIGWFAGETKVSDNASYTFTVNENTTLVAKFEKIEYTVTATASEGGTITDGYANGKKFEKGTSVTLTATPNDHYDFIGWFVGENEVGVNESYTFTVNENITLVAKFEKKTYRFLCNVQGNGSIWENNANATETYMYGATLSAGTKITLTAKPDAYWQFKGWYQSDGTSLISTDATYTFELTAHTVVCAIFEEKIMNNFIATSTPYEGGYITENNQTVDFGNGRMVEPGTQITLTAVANADYEFKGWYSYTADQQEVQISAEATYTFTVNEPTTVFAKFEEKVKYNFLAQCDPSNGGYITENNQTVDFGNGRQVEPGTKITLTAVANAGYAFKGWGTRDDEWNLTILSTNATYTFTVTENTYVQAVFEEKPNGLKLDAHNAGFTYNENGELVTTVYQIGNEIQPKIDYVGVYATYPTQQEKYLTINEDYTRDLGGLDFTKAGTYTVTYTYKADTSLTATLTVQVVEKPADGSLTEAEWNAAMAYWKAQTNVKVFERTVTSQSYDQSYGAMGADIRIYQLAGTAYSSDGYFEDDVSSQNYKGKMTYLVKTVDKYYQYTWYDGEWDSASEKYVGGYWIKNDYSAKEHYESEVSSNIYSFRGSNGDKIVFSYANFTFDAETKSYKNSDGSIAIAFTFDDNKVLTKIVVTVTSVYDDTDFSSTSVSTVTFGDAVVDVPTNAKCSFSTAVTAFTTTGETSGVGGCITKNGEQVSYRYAYLDDGTTLTLTAVADEGYVFKHWAMNVWDVDSRGYVWVPYSTDATYTVTVDGGDGTLYAVFEKVETEE